MNARTYRPSLGAFSLLELLVVVGMSALLAALLLLGLSRSDRRAKEAVCLNNLRQISIGMNLYEQQNGFRFPLRVSRKGSTGTPPDPKGSPRDWRFFSEAIGGVDPADPHPGIPPAKERPLFPYLGASQVFRCHFDGGWDFRPDGDFVTPSAFVALGCSYQYNGDPSGRNDPFGFEGIAGKPESWVPNPSKYILIYEPPAQEHETKSPHPYYVFWHRLPRAETLHSNGMWPQLQGRRLISPILFVDSHAAILDFSRNLGFDVNTEEYSWWKPEK